ncbi:hypothetical protein M5K25_022086 [Dendrobium thyrsiflorum]|uniref:Ubiquitin-like protease family profile domain-containing protein n=1 Tax=Dendrobium thyrsiflorum TaxID=117978 RepID=A0ABD0U5L8_DENTH
MEILELKSEELVEHGSGLRLWLGDLNGSISVVGYRTCDCNGLVDTGRRFEVRSGTELTRGKGNRARRAGQDRAKQMPYYRPVTSRCYVSTFRAICDSFREVLSVEVENSLRTVHIHQFLFFPAFQQNMPLMYELLKCWDSTEEGFKIKDQLLKFSTDEVAILTGLPNTGAEIIWHNEPLGGVMSTELKTEMTQLSRSTDDATVLKTFISFVLSNLFFPLNSLKTPRRLVSIASSLEEFSSINWAWTLREFLVNEFNRMATKLATEKPLGYINDFLPLLLVWFLEHINVNTPTYPDSRPRFLRWEGNTSIFYNSEKAANLVATLKEKQILYVIDGVSAVEAELVHADITSFQPPPSPLKQKSHEQSELPPTKKRRVKASQKQKSPDETKVEFQAAEGFAQPEWLSLLEERMNNLIDTVSRKIKEEIGDRLDKIEDNLHRVEVKVDDLQTKFINHCSQYPVTPAESSSSSTDSVDQTLAGWKIKSKIIPTVDAEPPIPMDDQTPTPSDQEATKLGDESPPVSTMQSPPSSPNKEPTNEESPSTKDQSPSTKEQSPSPKQQSPTTTGKEIVCTDEMQSPTTEMEIVCVSDTVKDLRRPAQTTMYYRGKEFLAQDMQLFIDECLRKYAYLEDVVFSTGNIILNRRDIDHILLDDCLDNFHIDAYAFFVDRKAKAIPAIYQPYLYISPMHRILNDYKDPSDLYIKHINKETLRRIHLLIIPIIHNNHWTLLVGRMKERVWKLYDSLPNPQHKDICVTVINELFKDLNKCFDADITKWRINIVRGTPTQSNSFDCGMFVCKYMDKVVGKDKVDWTEYKFWQNDMPRFRAEFAYQILLEGETVELMHVKDRIESAVKPHLKLM